MAEHGFFRHGSYDGAAFWRRLRLVYEPLRGRPWGVGENILWASPDVTASQAIEMWLKSPAHRKNMLAPACRETGHRRRPCPRGSRRLQGRPVTILTADFGAR